MTGTLSIVATPIGNMEDITLRALRVLKEVDYILCEDTRVTGNLLKHYEISTKTRHYDAHASERIHESVLHDLEAGKYIALVSDAGTPGISDPGVLLVERARDAGVRIDAIPGASAITAAFSIAGISGNSFVFLGFAPMKKGRQTFFKRLSEYGMPVIFYEAPHRIMKTLELLVEVSKLSRVPLESEREGIEEYYEFSQNETKKDQTIFDSWNIVVARELTKMYEEVVSGSPQEVLQYFVDHPDHVRGEFVVMVST